MWFIFDTEAKQGNNMDVDKVTPTYVIALIYKHHMHEIETVSPVFESRRIANI